MAAKKTKDEVLKSKIITFIKRDGTELKVSIFDLKVDYVSNKMSLSQVGRKYGVSKPQIWFLLNQYGIAIRKLKYSTKEVVTRIIKLCNPSMSIMDIRTKFKISNSTAWRIKKIIDNNIKVSELPKTQE